MKNKVCLNSYAKINLFLDIVNKREDGYHNIKSVMQEIDLHDIISIYNNKKSIEITCDNYDIPLNEKNTCYKAVKLIQEKYQIATCVNIDIQKRIPTEAGLGGGSSNAAYVIKGLNELWSLNMSEQDMLDIGVKIGADVPFCIAGGTCLCEGIGERLTRLRPFVWDNILIIKPDFSISTVLAYKGISSNEYNLYQDNQIEKYIAEGDYKSTCMAIANTLEIPALKLYPQIDDIKNDLSQNGAIASMLTGSGSCIYGFYEDKDSLKNAYNTLSKKYINMYIAKTISYATA